MFEILKPGLDLSHWYADKLVADIPDDQMVGQPVAGVLMNHAAWSLAHIAWANDNIISFLGKTPQLTSLKAIAGRGSKPSSDRSQYASKAELLKTLIDADARLWAAVTSASADDLNKPPPEQMRQMFPTVGHIMAGIMTGHLSVHLGQISAWRRAMGYPSLF